jgi:hypothetical protein
MKCFFLLLVTLPFLKAQEVRFHLKPTAPTSTDAVQLTTVTYALQVIPSLELTGLDPVELWFSTTLNATYQIKWSPDLVHWFDLGDEVLGDGREVLVNDSRDQATRFFYRLQQLNAEPVGKLREPILSLNLNWLPAQSL